MTKIGIYGGSFNPIHLGHLTIADYFLKECQLDFCNFIPSFVSPFKTDVKNNYKIEPIHRLKMLELALDQSNNFKVCDFEILNKGISYTYLTVEFLLEKNVDTEFYLLIGTDQALDFHKWKKWEWISDQVNLVIADRNIERFKEFEFQKLIQNSKVIYASSLATLTSTSK